MDGRREGGREGAMERPFANQGDVILFCSVLLLFMASRHLEYVTS